MEFTGTGQERVIVDGAELRGRLRPFIEGSLVSLLLLWEGRVEGVIRGTAQGTVVIVRAVTRQQGHLYRSAHIPVLNLPSTHCHLHRNNRESEVSAPVQV